jgi:N-acetyl sugar amidotransferase
MKIKYCVKCLFPDTKPDLYFDEEGVCDACRSAEQKWQANKSIDWNDRASEFNSILSNLPKDRLYDCVVPVSGGKDSTFQTYRMVKLHGLKALAVTFDQFDQTPIGESNLKMLKEIGVDHLHFTLNPQVVKKLVLRGFEEVGDLYWVNHVGIFSIPTRVATWMKIPLVVYGENPQFEYGGPERNRKPQPMNERWRQEFGGLRGLREDDLIDEQISDRDLEILRYPVDEDTKGISGVFYGDYFRWNPIEHTEFIKKIGWRPLDNIPVGSSTPDENCDMAFIDIREHVKYLKFGYGRATDQLNIAIRSGAITRSDALKKVIDIDGKVNQESIEKFCKYVGITKGYYNLLIERFVNKNLFRKNNEEWEFKYERY